MPLSSSDLVYRLSGGASNAVPAASLGGVKSSVALTGSTIFDTVSGAESAAGDVEYRGIYIHNAHATLTAIGAVLHMQTNTASSTTTIEIGIGTSALNGTEQTIADEQAAPSGVTFAPAASYAAGIVLGDIPPGQHRAVWFRRTITAGSAASSDTATPRITCDSEA